ncbi:MAG: hypothetical protein AAB250_11535, partial [Bdellovibrionota bacterium]
QLADRGLVRKVGATHYELRELTKPPLEAMAEFLELMQISDPSEFNSRLRVEIAERFSRNPGLFEKIEKANPRRLAHFNALVTTGILTGRLERNAMRAKRGTFEEYSNIRGLIDLHSAEEAILALVRIGRSPEHARLFNSEATMKFSEMDRGRDDLQFRKQIISLLPEAPWLFHPSILDVIGKEDRYELARSLVGRNAFRSIETRTELLRFFLEYSTSREVLRKFTTDIDPGWLVKMLESLKIEAHPGELGQLSRLAALRLDPKFDERRHSEGLAKISLEPRAAFFEMVDLVIFGDVERMAQMIPRLTEHLASQKERGLTSLRLLFKNYEPVDEGFFEKLRATSLRISRADTSTMIKILEVVGQAGPTAKAKSAPLVAELSARIKPLKPASIAKEGSTTHRARSVKPAARSCPALFR